MFSEVDHLLLDFVVGKGHPAHLREDGGSDTEVSYTR